MRCIYEEKRDRDEYTQQNNDMKDAHKMIAIGQAIQFNVICEGLSRRRASIQKKAIQQYLISTYADFQVICVC